MYLNVNSANLNNDNNHKNHTITAHIKTPNYSCMITGQTEGSGS